MAELNLNQITQGFYDLEIKNFNGDNILIGLMSAVCRTRTCSFDEVVRIFRMRFTFKNKKYNKDKHYYLVAYDESNGIEAFPHAVVMDLAFADDFGFGI